MTSHSSLPRTTFYSSTAPGSSMNADHTIEITSPDSGKSAKKRKTSGNAKDDGVKPAWSRLRKAKRPGYLARLTDTPLDILLEIFSKLQPGDLLNLARSSKALRRIVLNRTLAGGVWRSAFVNVSDPRAPMPPCPEDLSLVRYANLVYDRYCFECGSTEKLEVCWPEYTRLCPECFNNNFIEVKFQQDNTVDQDLSRLVYHRFRSVGGKLRGPLCFKRAHESLQQRLTLLEPDREAYNAYVKDETRRALVRSNLSNEIRSWGGRTRKLKKADGVEKRRAVQDAYKTKLVELGYQREVDRLSSRELRSLPGFKGVKPLDEKRE
ncbi:hypothetical protein FA15DRAFT_201250 [Coprinopsis marcescibilis]|uniref:F-box domain-containing protein n=1 Tax=Coprinopsis marcescibilis TaxID=230819 RepID=A0A5C3LE12_COPMA|nr:hypothetical protein FA15DRAFT_201250 [Coprinopsis marcescibilis]